MHSSKTCSDTCREISMRRQLISAGILLAVFCGSSAGQRALDRAEILEILRGLTNSPRTGWISSGEIEARHLEYRTDTNQIIESDVTVRYDGNRFYWQIDISSDSLEPTNGRGGAKSGVDTNRNRHRVFAWDGKRYTLYCRSGDYAMVSEDTGRAPVVVNGPLTAGLVPWGYGRFTYERLSGSELSAAETQRDGRPVIELAIEMGESLRMEFVLDAEKEYAVLSSTARNKGRSIVLKTYDGYHQAGVRWAPQTVEIEIHDDSRTPAELVSYDHWHLTAIRSEISASRPFDVELASGTLVEEYTGLSARPMAYYKRQGADTEGLRQRRMEMVAAGQAQGAGCAAVTARYVLSRAGKEMTRQQTDLLAGGGAGASLGAIKGVLEGAGLYCGAVRTDIEGLRKAGDCEVILHLPGRRHFVVLDHIDDSHVWLIDLDHDRFYFPVEIGEFGLDWTAGTALLVRRDRAVEMEGLQEIGESQLKGIVGADSFGTYSCSQRIQESYVVLCSEGFGGVPCFGTYRIYEERFACELSAGGGSCGGGGILGCYYTHCIEDPYYPGECAVTGEWFAEYIHACR